MNEKTTFTGIIGSIFGVVGTSMQADDILRIISLVITIVGGIITWIIIPILTWYNKAKKDGKIDSKEIQEGINILEDGIDKIKKGDKKNED